MNVLISTFKEAFIAFLNKCDSVDINTIESFKSLKDNGFISHTNETEYWCGNHHSSTTRIRLNYVESPCKFFVLEVEYDELSDNSHSTRDVTVFVV